MFICHKDSAATEIMNIDVHNSDLSRSPIIIPLNDPSLLVSTNGDESTRLASWLAIL